MGATVLLFGGCETERQGLPRHALREGEEPQRAPPLVCEPAIATAEGRTSLTVTHAGVELIAYRGLGDGTFGVATTSSTHLGESVVDLAFGDFDGDGRTELAVCDELGVLVVQP